MNSQSNQRAPRLAALFLAAASVLFPASYARSAAPIEDKLTLFIKNEARDLPGRVEISISPLDDRLKLAPCAGLEPFVPKGTRLWGRTMLGVRCVDGASWSVLLPAEIRVFAPALVATRMLPAGQPIEAADLRLEEIDITREAQPAVSDPESLTDMTLTRALAAGQVLRKDYLRPKPAVKAGEPVKLVYRGAGFQISSEGRAVSTAAAGLPVRVQVSGGRIVNGIAQPGPTVEIRP